MPQRQGCIWILEMHLQMTVGRNEGVGHGRGYSVPVDWGLILIPVSKAKETLPRFAESRPEVWNPVTRWVLIQ